MGCPLGRFAAAPPEGERCWERCAIASLVGELFGRGGGSPPSVALRLLPRRGSGGSPLSRFATAPPEGERFAPPPPPAGGVGFGSLKEDFDGFSTCDAALRVPL